MQQRLAIKGPQRPTSRPRPTSGPRMDVRFCIGIVALIIYTTWAMLEYVRMQTDQVKMGRELEHLVADRTENEKTLRNLNSEAQVYQSNTRYIEQAIQDFKLDLKGSTQANVVKVDAYGNVLRTNPQGSGNGLFAEATR